MKVLLVICAFALIVSAQGQASSDRRGRLRSLIASARTGDPSARKTLQALRTQLRERRLNTGEPKRAPQPETVVEVTTFRPVKPVFNEEPQIVIMEPTIPVQVEIPVQQTRRTTSRQRTQTVRESEGSVRRQNRPHTTLHRGLEVDNRSELNANIRVTNETRTPPIETIRRYAYYDDAGNYIFGYEAADGSFKEEKRGLNCIVQGKYGYVDPDGVKREFTYVSGNKCSRTSNVDLQGHPIDSQIPIDTEPATKQFLHQTQSQQLSKVELNQLALNRRRGPGARRRQRPTSRPVPVESEIPKIQEIPTPVESKIPRIQEIPASSFPSFQQAQHDRSPVEPKPRIMDTPVRTVKPVTSAPVQGPAGIRAPVQFRPTPKPVAFNFEQEFKNIFDNFANVPATSRPVRPRTSAPIPVRTRAPEPIIVKAPVSSKPATSAPVSKKTAAPAPAPLASAGHQLVFDAASGTFKTIPIKNLVNAHNLPTGKPLPLFSNPLPSVPTGSLSFGGSKGAANTEAFDKFFKQFTIRQTVP